MNHLCVFVKWDSKFFSFCKSGWNCCLQAAGTSPHPRRWAQGWTPRFPPLWIPFPLFLSLTQTRDRQPLRKGERQSGYSYVYFVKYSQFIDSLLLHISVTLRRRDTSVSRNSFTRCYRQFLRITIINNLYRMVRQGEFPEGQEKVP